MSRLFHFLQGGSTICTSTWGSSGIHESAHKIYVPQSGRGFYDVGLGETELRAGRLYLIPGGRRHRYRCPHNFHVRWLHLHAVDHALDQLLAGIPAIRSWPIAHWHHAQSAWTALDDFFPHREPAADLRLQALLAEITAEIIGDVPPPPPEASIMRARLAPAAAWLDAHACANPQLARAAREAGLSPIHFHRLATRCWGETPHARVQRVRLEKSAAMLRNDRDTTVAVIAQHCGFTNPFYFTRAFTRRFGVAPTLYRRRAAP